MSALAAAVARSSPLLPVWTFFCATFSPPHYGRGDAFRLSGGAHTRDENSVRNRGADPEPRKMARSSCPRLQAAS
jgi:hypothetical protein